jgi:hypothetical protein
MILFNEKLAACHIPTVIYDDNMVPSVDSHKPQRPVFTKYLDR